MSLTPIWRLILTATMFLEDHNFFIFDGKQPEPRAGCHELPFTIYGICATDDIHETIVQLPQNVETGFTEI